ncbi:outer membrane protein [Emcibacter sp.]|uniref:outer membrane protein n=1 Tax=Emcibacter sp. TaxID=1979954 RepID=UPI002AA5FF57|nr:outer membrane beta-barrel protein [Emcibacter sp.]
MSDFFTKLLVIIGIASTAPVLSSTAQAGMDNTPFDGFYLGLRADYYKETANATYEQITGDTDSAFTGITGEESGNGFRGGFYGGYGISFGPVYTSLEAGWGLSSGASDVTDGTVQVGIKASNSFDINGRVGLPISDRYLVYVLGGYAATKFNTSGFATNEGDRLNGFRYGGGFEIGIFEDVALRVEYTRAEYGGLTITQGVDRFTFDPSEQRISVGIVLHMD